MFERVDKKAKKLAKKIKGHFIAQGVTVSPTGDMNVFAPTFEEFQEAAKGMSPEEKRQHVIANMDEMVAKLKEFAQLHPALVHPEYLADKVQNAFPKLD